MGHPRPLYHLFSVFSSKQNFFKQIDVKKYPCSICRLGFNSQPSDYESLPVTTRPGLPPKFGHLLLNVAMNVDLCYFPLNDALFTVSINFCVRLLLIIKSRYRNKWSIVWTGYFCLLWKWPDISVTRWLDYLFNIWPLRTIIICPIV